jgi:aminoglycoside phosphotransferase (APT) family kinase protein
MAISAKRLTAWLRSSGAMPNGRVTNVEVDLEAPTEVSTLTFLRATYSADAPVALPTALVVKRPGAMPDAAGREVEFFRRLAPTLTSPSVVRCLAALDDAAEYPNTLVLEDLRATHDHRPWPLPPSRQQAETAVDALAEVHAHWWDHADLGRSIGQSHTKVGLTSMVANIAALVPGFLDALDDAISLDNRRLYERVFSSSLRPWLRLAEPHALTISHGDAHSWNVLFPRSGEGPAVLIDWQLWHVDVGARDLAFFMALHWYPDRRRELEMPLLRRYHERLCERGVANYAFDDLLLDYRRGVVRNLTVPILFWQRSMKAEAWYHRLECGLSAYRELGCDEVL